MNLGFSQVAPEIGLRDRTPHTYAFTNAKIILSPGNEISNGALVIRDQKIIRAGSDIEIPKDARVMDLTGKTIYPGFIDLFVETHAAVPSSPHPHWNSYVHPESTTRLADLEKENADALRKIGFTSAMLIPEKGIFKGRGQLVNIGDEKTNVFSGAVPIQSIAFEHGSWEDDEYPNSLMGTIALIRQTFYDAQWYDEALAAWKNSPLLNMKPVTDDALQAAATHLLGGFPFIFAVADDINALRALKISREFNLTLWMAGSGYEYRRVNEIAEAAPFIILPLNFPAAPDVSAEEYAIDVSLRDLRHWDLAPENPGILTKHRIPFSLTSAKLKDRDRFRKNISHAVFCGLDKNQALKALTVIPAKQMGVEKILGTIEAGKYANFLITDGDYFDTKTQILSVWVEGSEYVQAPLISSDSIEGKWEALLPGSSVALHVLLKQKKDRYSGSVKQDSVTVPLKKLKHEPPFIFFSFDGEKLTGFGTGVYRFSGTLSAGNISGTLTSPAGDPVNMSLAPVVTTTGDIIPEEPEFPAESQLTIRYPEGAFGMASPPDTFGDLLIKNATIWTSSDAGILKSADIWIKNDKFYKIGQNLNLPPTATIIDAQGKVITPGLIDCHSHTALSAVNEGSQSITSEVRCQDVINPDDISIYRELAGGLTMANLLHGSANPIGGQNAVVKLKWGETADGMVYQNAPEGIKFALGENVKQSNWGDKYTTRYPQTRMGVDQIIRDGFSAALEYRQKWSVYTALSKRDQKKIAPPRIDLELQALDEVLNHQRLVHCHSYRQDEILNLMRIADDFGFSIRTFQHILEGYKVADAMREHGAGGSTFSDWWAYKFEVYDAIPFNAALMHQEGVIVSLNSDSNELARRLNLEAAKAVKYGDVPSEDALKMVTLYPAQQLMIDQWVGSIEPGKDADFVIWSGDPLSVYSKCEQTWIDGKNYFNVQTDLDITRHDEAERRALIQKIMSTPDKEGEEGNEPNAPHYLEHSCGTEVVR